MPFYMCGRPHFRAIQLDVALSRLVECLSEAHEFLGK